MEEKMPFYEREDSILQIWEEKKEISNRELAQRLFISLPTLRRDLEKLEKKGLIVRTHGFCGLNRQIADEKIPFYYREQRQNSQKQRIAKKALQYIRDGNVIMLDASTSAYNIVPLLSSFQNLIVITNSAKASYTLGTMAIKNISTGGHMITKSLSFVGSEAVETISRYYADVVFFSCHGLAPDGRVTDNSVEENEVRKAMISHAGKKILLCDSSKIGRSCFHTLCHISQVDDILCDIPLLENYKALMRQNEARDG